MSSVSSMSGRSSGAGSNQPSSSSSIRSASVASCSSIASSSSAPGCNRGRTHHKSNCSCSNNGCLGAIPRNPSSASSSTSTASNRHRTAHRTLSPSATAAYGGTLKNVTNINYNLMYSNSSNESSNTTNSSGSSSNPNSYSNTNHNNNYGSSGDPLYSNTLTRTRLPTIKESPVHITGNHKNRWVEEINYFLSTVEFKFVLISKIIDDCLCMHAPGKSSRNLFKIKFKL